MPLKTKEAQREYQRRWMANRRQEFFKDKSCVECGSKDRLELDHIDRTTKISHAIWSWTESRRNEEIKKCQVLCYKCHKRKTKVDVYGNCPQHGSTGYRHGCRCEICRDAEKTRMRIYRASKI